jgi:hypothetical protein
MASDIPPTKLAYNQTVLEEEVYNIDPVVACYDATCEDGTESVIGIEITHDAIVDINSTDSNEDIGATNIPPPASITHYEGLTWDTCDYGLDGTVVGVHGKIWKNLPVVKLRTICSKLQVYGVKNCKKDFMI